MEHRHPIFFVRTPSMGKIKPWNSPVSNSIEKRDAFQHVSVQSRGPEVSIHGESSWALDAGRITATRVVETGPLGDRSCISIGHTMPGLPGSSLPSMNRPQGSLLILGSVAPYGRAIHAVRWFTQVSQSTMGGAACDSSLGCRVGLEGVRHYIVRRQANGTEIQHTA